MSCPLPTYYCRTHSTSCCFFPLPCLHYLLVAICPFSTHPFLPYIPLSLDVRGMDTNRWAWYLPPLRPLAPKQGRAGRWGGHVTVGPSHSRSRASYYGSKSHTGNKWWWTFDGGRDQVAAHDWGGDQVAFVRCDSMAETCSPLPWSPSCRSLIFCVVQSLCQV